MDELAPHSEEAEMGILGSMLLSPDECIKEFREKVKAGSEVFYDLRHRTICETLIEMHGKGEPIDSITIKTRLKDRSLLDAIGGVAYLSSLPDSVPSAANFGYYLKLAHDKYTLRRVNQTVLEAKNDLTNNPEKVDTILRTFGDSIHDLRTVNGLAWDGARAKLAGVLRKCRFDQDNPPPLVLPIYSVGLVPLSSPGNLTTIFAAPKGGKSAWVAAMMAAAMTQDRSRDTFSITSQNPHGFALLHFDSEQSERDHWEHVERARIRAGLERVPDWLYSYWFTGISDVQERRDLLFYALEEAKERHGGIHSVLIDGVADLVRDPNDQKECNPFVAELHALAGKYAAPICGIIHLNPNTEKTRGHLGSQLERKSETNLKLEKDSNEITTVWSEKQRRAPIVKAFGPRFKWSHEHGMHMTCQCQADEKLAAKREKYSDEVQRVFTDRGGLRWGELRDEIMNRIKVKEDAAAKRIDDYKELGIVLLGPGKLYVKAA